ncbi:AI-2E family transporter [Methanobrevibacter sp.]|uniref:AI-2E family transporter n=1 Tax=Methanobrevibacter sp. TaxID=66852 RepID=UPI00388FE24D
MSFDIKNYLTPPVLLILFLLIISLMFIFPVLNMIVLGAILAYGIRPVAFKIQSKLKYSSISTILAMVVVLIPLILLVAYVSFELYNFVNVLLASNFSLDVDRAISQLSAYLPLDTVAMDSNIDSTITQVGNFLLNHSANVLGKFANITLDLFILIFSVFYFVRDGDRCFNFIRDFVPSEYGEFFDNTVESVKDVLKSIFYGHVLTSVIIGIFGCIGYYLLGYPFGIFLGVITGILQLIPIFGPWPVYWALFFMDVFSGNYPRAVVVLIFGLFLSTVDMYIRPALSSHYAEIHPLILLIGFLSGPLVYGLVGFVVGPLILAVTYTVLDSYRKEFLISEG